MLRSHISMVIPELAKPAMFPTLIQEAKTPRIIPFYSFGIHAFIIA